MSNTHIGLVLSLNPARKVRDTTKDVLQESFVVRVIGTIREAIWPGGALKTGSAPRSIEDRGRTREDANRKLSSLIPGESDMPFSAVFVID